MTTFRYAERAARLIRAARARIRPHRSAPPENAIAAIAEAIERAASRQRRRRMATAVGLATAILGAIAFVAAAPWRSPRTIAVVPTPAPASVPRATLVAGSEVRATLASADGQLRPLAAGTRVGFGRAAADRRAAGHTGGCGRYDGRPRAAVRPEVAACRRRAVASPGTRCRRPARRQAASRAALRRLDARRRGGGPRHAVSRGARVARRELRPWNAHPCRRGRRRRRGPLGGGRGSRSRGTTLAGSLSGAARAPLPPSPSVVTRRLPRPAPATPASTLATENDLFGAALRAERSGDRAEAAHLLDALLTRFPQSPLRESAQRARARVTATALPSR